MQEFTHFIGIDWTGAKGKSHAGLAVVCCEKDKCLPQVISPPSGRGRWSRAELLRWISCGIGRRRGERVLVGIDASFGMPFLDQEGYLPALKSVTDIHLLWQNVATYCPEGADFYGGTFVDLHRDHYLRPVQRGQFYQRRMRVAEELAVASGAGPCESVFHLVGPSQVGLASLSTMAVLDHLRQLDHIAVWPFDDIERILAADVVLVEIYAAAFAALGGHRGKFKRQNDMERALRALGISQMSRLGLGFNDHIADACVTAAGLRNIASVRKYWNPPALSAKVRRTEGWIFGIV